MLKFVTILYRIGQARNTGLLLRDLRLSNFSTTVKLFKIFLMFITCEAIFFCHDGKKKCFIKGKYFKLCSFKVSYQFTLNSLANLKSTV